MQWRFWPDNGCGVIDQIDWVVREIKRNPESRRLLVSAWNVADLPHVALPPCHFACQFYVVGGCLSCQVYQRSADAFIGLPWNIASYALLISMVAQVCALAPGELVHTLGDVHLYRPHLDLAQVQLRRKPFAPPRLALDAGVRSLDEFTVDHCTLIGYQAHPAIKACVAV